MGILYKIVRYETDNERGKVKNNTVNLISSLNMFLKLCYICWVHRVFFFLYEGAIPPKDPDRFFLLLEEFKRLSKSLATRNARMR